MRPLRLLDRGRDQEAAVHLLPLHRVVVSNCSWKCGELTVTLRQPFDLLAETTLGLEKKKAAGGIANGPSQIWLAGLAWFRHACPRCRVQPGLRSCGLPEHARELAESSTHRL